MDPKFLETSIAFHKKLLELRNQLYTSGVEYKFKDGRERSNFIRFRIKFTDFTDDLLNGVAEILVDKLEENDKELNNGIEKLQTSIKEVNDSKKILVAFASLLKTISKIITTKTLL